jgi:hypothetical protein
MSKINKTSGCWEWTAAKNAFGYGRISVFTGGKYRALLAHRVAYELLVGEIPEGLHIDHMCHNPGCVNPAHLRPVTNKENLENLVGAFSNSKSGVRGVSWDKRASKWRATITHNRRSIHVGFHEAIAEAEEAVIAKRLELFTHNDADKLAA